MPGDPVNIPHDIENRAVATGIDQELTPQVIYERRAGVKALPGITSWLLRTTDQSRGQGSAPPDERP
jgi:hypothetical protein